jgi:ubiquinone/menaquinone biosynthesis C-methylase UbiE
LSFEDETFDFINIKGCLHHIKNTEKVIAEVYRCLKNGGMFRLQEPNHSIKEKLPDNSEEILERTLNYKEIIDILNKSGFAIWKKKLLLHFQTNDKLNKYTGNENLKNLIVKIMNPVCDFWGFGDIFLIVAVKGKR